VTVEPAAASGGHLVRLLAEMGRTLLGTRSLTEILNRVVDVAFEAVPAERAFLMLRDSADEGVSARVMRHRDGTVPTNATLSRQVVRRVMRDRVAVLAADATTDPALGVSDSILRFNIRAFMCAPLWSHDEVIGVLYVDSSKSARFAVVSDDDPGLVFAASRSVDRAGAPGEPAARGNTAPRAAAAVPLAVGREPHPCKPPTRTRTCAQEREVTVMFCDIVGFTSLCEQLPPAAAPRCSTAS
jgi:hypothetical protein